MKLRVLGILSLASLFLVAGHQEKEVNVMVMSHGGDEGPVRIEFTNENGNQEMNISLDGGDITFDPTTLEAGESETFTLDNGDEVVISRLVEGGLTLNVGGEDIQLLSLHEGGLHHVGEDGEHEVVIHSGSSSSHSFVVNGDDDGGEHVFIHKDGVSAGNIMMKLHTQDGVNISGLGDLDEETQAKIRKALQDAGIDKDINFSDMNMLHSTSGNVWISDDGQTHTGMKVFEFTSEDGKTTEVKVIKEDDQEKKK